MQRLKIKTKMKKLIILSFVLLIMSCKKDDSLIDDGTVIWKPRPVAIIDNNSVQLKWLNCSIFNEVLLPYTFVDPDNFEIYISKGTPDNFTKLVELKNDRSYSYQIKGLSNGESYYFYVVSKKKRYSPLVSDTIMAIPNPMTELKTIITVNDSHTISSVSLSPQKDKIAYVDKFYSWGGGENCCMAVAILTSNINGSGIELIEINAHEPYWSPKNDKIIFRLESDDIQIAVYDIKSKNVIELTTGNDEKYAPACSENGNLILFESPKNSNANNPGGTPTNIWLLDINTHERTQITDIENINLRKAGMPNWINNESFLFQGKGQDYKFQIYESSIITKEVNHKIISDWNDYCPSISPDKKNIAFISDRSGENYIWIYSMEKNSLKQLTGFPTLGGVDRYWNRIKWINNTDIIFTYNENKLLKLKIN